MKQITHELCESKPETMEGDHVDNTTVVAIDRDKNSHCAVMWAVDNILAKNSTCGLIHVQTHSLHPQDTVSKEARPPTEAEQQFFLPFRGFCARKGVASMELVLDDIDVSKALAHYVANNFINNVVVGASHRNVLTRKFRNPDVPSCLLKSLPESCTLYVISKGKVQNFRCGIPSRSISIVKEKGLTDVATHMKHSQPVNSPRPLLDSPDYGDANRTMFNMWSFRSKGSGSLDGVADTKQLTPTKSRQNFDSILESTECSSSGNSPHQDPLPRKGDILEQPSSQSSDMSCEAFPVVPENFQTPKALEAEMIRLKLDLEQTMDKYHSVCREAITEDKAARALQIRAVEERNLVEARLAEDAAFALAVFETQKTQAAFESVRISERLVEMEIQKRIKAEIKVKLEEEERKVLHSKTLYSVRFRRYTIDEIEKVTNYFQASFKIGEGGYGPVYRAVLDHTDVAIKVLRPDISCGQMQFQREVEVLSNMRHPNMVLLLGACPEYGCLVYEYMENGSLEDRLLMKNDTPPIPWRTRFKITADIATALNFLHQKKPEPLVHRDLKPANILLDHNYVSKIGDVGLARLVPASLADQTTQYCITAAAGTFCYIDPEYQQTGKLGVKSDIYSLGIVLLQIITAKPPMGLSHQVEKAIEEGTFAEILDPAVIDWPFEETLSFAKLALKCCELRKRDRPDLDSVILPELNRLKHLGMNDDTMDIQSNTYKPLPHHSSISELTCKKIKLKIKQYPSKSISKLGSFSCSRGTSRLLPPTTDMQVGKAGKKNTESCWSFVSCSNQEAPLQKFKSFVSCSKHEPPLQKFSSFMY